MAALSAALRADPRVELAEGERAAEILVRDGCAAGLRTIGGTGGCASARARGRAGIRDTAGLPAHAQPPRGDGRRAGAGARAGAALADLELVQFQPTALALGEGPLPLVSEAVRGEGAILRDARGRRFMPDVHPMAELGPRDVVAHAMARRAAELGGEVTLDLRHLDADGCGRASRPSPRSARSAGSTSPAIRSR